MRVVSVVSTKGGVGKTTVAANLGGLLADAGLRVLLLDLDSQPTLSSYYALSQKADVGAYEFIALTCWRQHRLKLMVNTSRVGR
ncbi:Iron-sulfur cluster carrier protein [Pseudomonas fluorescens]|uniref:Iron-sulfur cluster carrier protein n=1 Tax=Pseudomonas fluorescens TaxID=294 RepID=A0A5E6S7N2_PSEFL|nr:Iron-sulfur cluster carrier protein [Pseudomonas fluorescens]